MMTAEASPAQQLPHHVAQHELIRYTHVITLVIQDLQPEKLLKV
jgi:hypothetical protein